MKESSQMTKPTLKQGLQPRITVLQKWMNNRGKCKNWQKPIILFLSVREILYDSETFTWQLYKPVKDKETARLVSQNEFIVMVFLQVVAHTNN